MAKSPFKPAAPEKAFAWQTDKPLLSVRTAGPDRWRAGKKFNATPTLLIKAGLTFELATALSEDKALLIEEVDDPSAKLSPATPAAETAA